MTYHQNYSLGSSGAHFRWGDRTPLLDKCSTATYASLLSFSNKDYLQHSCYPSVQSNREEVPGPNIVSEVEKYIT